MRVLVMGRLLALGAAIAFVACSPVQASGGATSVATDRTDVTLTLAAAKDVMRADPVKAAALAQHAEALLQNRPHTEANIIALAKPSGSRVKPLCARTILRMPAAELHMALACYRGIKRPLKLRGDLLLTRGGVDTVEANVSGALADYQTAHNIFRQLGETRSQAIALQQIASLYREADDFETAMRYDAQSAEIYKGDLGLEVSNYNNRANYLVENGRYDEAVAQYRLALGVARELKSAGLEARIIRNIARTQLKANKLAAADATIATGMRLTASGESKAGRDQMLAIAAQAALQRGNLAKAAAEISATFKGVDLTDTSLSYRDAHETAYKIFSKNGRADLALAHLEALKRLDDQTAKLAASTNTALMAARFDDANKDAKIAKLKADDAIKNVAFEKARARQQQVVFAGIVFASLIGVSMLIVGLVTIRRSRNEVRAANIDLAATNTALEKALAAKTEFLATTSHEIRTPLNGILGMTQVMLADRNLGEATRDRLSVVHGAGITMRALVDDILDVAKMETGNLTLETVPLDLHATMRDVSRLWEEQAQARGIRFVVELDQCPAMIEGDAARLRQIVFNLLSNALKFTAQGVVTLRVEAASAQQLRIAVSDTGIGIPADKLEVIFESFRQVDAGTTRKFGGTGLGLSICRNLARAMGGEITVTSVTGQGSTFAVMLPLCLAEPVDQRVENEQGNGLLIVDRNPISRSMFRALLAPRAGEVALVSSAAEAERWIAANGPSLVLIDDATIKAEENPHNALAEIAAAAHGKTARIALLWASPTAEDVEILGSAGVDTIIPKPIGGAALVDMLYPAPTGGSPDTVSSHLVSQAA